MLFSKLRRRLDDYTHLVMFDLATHVTGICVWDIAAHRPTITMVIQVPTNVESSVATLDSQLDKLFTTLWANGLRPETALISQEAMPTQMGRGGSTVQTFLSLARSHAVLELYAAHHGLVMYDEVGVYPVTTHAYLRRLLSLPQDVKVDTALIRRYVEDTYGLANLTLDESDAVFLAQTFVDVKFNQDIQDAIRATKRHLKELKQSHRIEELRRELDRLATLKTVEPKDKEGP